MMKALLLSTSRATPPYFVPLVRFVHSTASKSAFAPALDKSISGDVVPQDISDSENGSHATRPKTLPPASNQNSTSPPLSILPLSTVMRTYLITAMSSSPLLLNSCISVLLRMLDSKNALTNPDRNQVLRYILKKTFYDQFCIGETKKEVEKNVAAIKALGYKGVIFEYALEVLASGKDVPAADSEITKSEIETWRKGMLETVEMASPGDFIGLKWSGLGTYALHLLQNNRDPSPEMWSAMLEVAELAAAKGALLLPSAEEERTNVGIDAWTLKLEKKLNTTPGKALVYCTYQTYLKSTPDKLARHLALAKQEGFTAGVKLVRGAYLATEPRSNIWETIEKTHEAYDGLAEACLRKQYGGILKPAPDNGNRSFPDVSVFLATHNSVSVNRAMAIRNEQIEKKEPMPELSYGQLLGMADEVSTKLIAAGKLQNAQGTLVDIPRAFKCVCWGTTGQCLNFLLRRASENKDAAGRTTETRKAMGSEMLRRARAAFLLMRTS